ncbi:transposase [Streptomyces sp. NEAU-174]|uniref:transposase n=1 Tax=Streptomyces sp. NEAU-174 TaxID=3458254 RepID=UPI00404500EF
MTDPASVVGAIGDQRTMHSIWKPTGREVRRQQLAEAVKDVFTQSGGTYGSPKIWITLMRQGW